MGNKLVRICRHAGVGDTLQTTRKGLSFYRLNSNMPTFTTV